MTPKEKAQELIDKMERPLNDDYVVDYNPYYKECALIIVDEIIESNPYKITLEGKYLTEHIKYDINFWKEVKQEIELL